MGRPMFNRYSVSVKTSHPFSQILLVGFPMFSRYSVSVKNFTSLFPLPTYGLPHVQQVFGISEKLRIPFPTSYLWVTPCSEGIRYQRNTSHHFSHILLMGYPMFRRYSESVKNISINFRYIEMVIYLKNQLLPA